MLKKLLYYDFRALLRTTLLFCLLSPLSGLLGGILTVVLGKIEVTSPFASVFLGILSLGSFLLTAMPALLTLLYAFLLLFRFYTTMFTDEGYLTFMLPMRRTLLFGGKLLSGLLHFTAMGAVMLLSYLILLLFPELFLDENGTLTLVRDFFRLFSAFEGGALATVSMIVGTVAQVYSALMLGYTAVVMGASYFKRHKVLGAVLFSIVLFTATELLSTLLGAALLLGYGMEDMYSSFPILLSGLLSFLLFTGLGVAAYFLARRLIVTRLNLE